MPLPTEVEWSDIEPPRIRGNLQQVRTFEEALACFGFGVTDKIDRRTQVIMFKAIQEALETSIEETTRRGDFRKARQVRTALTSIEAGFRSLQLTSSLQERKEQEEVFSRSSRKLMRHLRSLQEQEEEYVETVCDELEREMNKKHRIQEELLEREISFMRLPRMKKSKRLLELENAETWLIRQSRYEEAENVRRMIKKQHGLEEAVHRKNYEDSIQKMRNTLTEDHTYDEGRVKEKTGSLRWSERRERGKEHERTLQTITNTLEDMEHAHHMEARKKAEMTVKPSFLLARRAHYDGTGAVFRGSQLQDKERKAETDWRRRGDSLGRTGSNSQTMHASSSLPSSKSTFVNTREMSRLRSKLHWPSPSSSSSEQKGERKRKFVASLVERHNFEQEPLDGTVTYFG